jgi:hypothetical protein
MQTVARRIGGTDRRKTQGRLPALSRQGFRPS